MSAPGVEPTNRRPQLGEAPLGSLVLDVLVIGMPGKGLQEDAASLLIPLGTTAWEIPEVMVSRIYARRLGVELKAGPRRAPLAITRAVGILLVGPKPSRIRRGVSIASASTPSTSRMSLGPTWAGPKPLAGTASQPNGPEPTPIHSRSKAIALSPIHTPCWPHHPRSWPGVMIPEAKPICPLTSRSKFRHR